MKTAFRIPLFNLIISIIFLYGTTLFTLQSQLSAAIYADSLDIEQGTITLETKVFKLVILKSSHTVAGLNSDEAPEFDFSPGELLNRRKKVGFYHLGDLNFRY